MSSGYLFFCHCVNEFSLNLTHNFDYLGIWYIADFRLLFECGANANEIYPETKSSPIRLLCRSYNLDINNTIILVELLLDANTHLDCVDADDR